MNGFSLCSVLYMHKHTDMRKHQDLAPNSLRSKTNTAGILSWVLLPLNPLHMFQFTLRAATLARLVPLRCLSHGFHGTSNATQNKDAMEKLLQLPPCFIQSDLLFRCCCYLFNLHSFKMTWSEIDHLVHAGLAQGKVVLIPDFSCPSCPSYSVFLQMNQKQIKIKTRWLGMLFLLTTLYLQRSNQYWRAALCWNPVTGIQTKQPASKLVTAFPEHGRDELKRFITQLQKLKSLQSTGSFLVIWRKL